MPQDFRRQADRVDRMATRVGVDLEEALFRGDISPDTISDAVIACAGCPDPAHCDGWLARAEAAEQPELATPGYCRNRDLLAGLQMRGL